MMNRFELLHTSPRGLDSKAILLCMFYCLLSCCTFMISSGWPRRLVKFIVDVPVELPTALRWRSNDKFEWSDWPSLFVSLKKDQHGTRKEASRGSHIPTSIHRRTQSYTPWNKNKEVKVFWSIVLFRYQVEDGRLLVWHRHWLQGHHPRHPATQVVSWTMQGNNHFRRKYWLFSTRAIFDGTPGQKPRIEFVETLSTEPLYFVGLIL
jgi:hypothetical protein